MRTKIHKYTCVNCINGNTCTIILKNKVKLGKAKVISGQQESHKGSSLGRLNRNTGHDKKSITCNTRKLPKFSKDINVLIISLKDGDF